MNPRPLRILGIGECNDLAAMYLSLAQRGHAVRVFVADPEFHGVFAGLLPRTPDWRSELDWVRAAGSDGVVYPSVRRAGGWCIGIFWPDVIAVPVQGRHYSYHWDGQRVDFVRQHDTGQVLEVA